MLKRLFDILLGLLAVIILFIPLLIIALAVKLTSDGPAIHWSSRIGQNNKVFKMPKFRSMRTDTPQLATHLLEKPENFITPVGKILRKTSLDELPQLWSVLIGKMSFVGPRPALYNQDDLIEMRKQLGVDSLRPGITGWAQINGRDDLPLNLKVQFDEYYLKHRSLPLDLKIILRTALQVFSANGVQH